MATVSNPDLVHSFFDSQSDIHFHKWREFAYEHGCNDGADSTVLRHQFRDAYFVKVVEHILADVDRA